MQKYRLPILFLMLTAAATGWSQQLLQWSASQGGNDHYYQLIAAPNGITWSEASLSATNRGGYLATATSSAENDFIFSVANANPAVWHVGYGPWLGGLQPVG